MTEEEAKKALFELNKAYMSNPPKERLKLYDEYIKNRNIIKDALIKNIEEKKKSR